MRITKVNFRNILGLTEFELDCDGRGAQLFAARVEDYAFTTGE